MTLCCLSLMDVQWITVLFVTNPIQKAKQRLLVTSQRVDSYLAKSSSLANINISRHL